MRFTSVGEVLTLDFAPVRALLPACYEEWRALQFGADGRAVNSLTGAPDDSVSLVHGVHRHGGAVYAFSTAATRRPTRVKASGATLVLLREEHHGRTDLSITQHDDTYWRADVEVHHHAGKRPPRVAGDVKVDLTELLRQSTKKPLGFGVSWLVGGSGKVSFEVDSGVLEGSGGRLAEVSGRLNRFPFSAVVEITDRSPVWLVNVRLALRARGIARPVLWIAGRKIRRSVDDWFAATWAHADERAWTWQDELRSLAATTAAAGGPTAFVRQRLWADETDDDATA